MRENQYEERLNRIRTKYGHKKQNEINKYHFTVQSHRGHEIGVSSNQILERQRSQQKSALRSDRFVQIQNKVHKKQTLLFDTLNPRFKNDAVNHNYNPSPIKMIGLDTSFGNSPTKTSNFTNQIQSYAILKPYNRTETQYIPYSTKKQVSFDLRSHNTIKYNFQFQDSSPNQNIGQKFDYNVNKIDKIQDRINQILNRHK